MATKEYFPGIGKIKFEGKDSKNPMAFRYYDAEKMINGRSMKDWLKFAMAWWHTLCAEGGDQFGGEPNSSHGTVTLIPCRLPRIKWMPVSSLCRKWASGIIASMMSILSLIHI